MEHLKCTLCNDTVTPEIMEINKGLCDECLECVLSEKAKDLGK